MINDMLLAAQIMKKYEEGMALSDVELKRLHRAIGGIVIFLQGLGPEWKLAYSPLRTTFNQLGEMMERRNL